MINLSREFCRKAREARREAGLTQHELSLEIGCKQSALSMFEQGDGTKISDSAIEKLAKKFGIEITGGENEKSSGRTAAGELAAAGTGFCPNPHCPSNIAYNVEERRFLRPDRKLADPVGGKYCAMCGELLERHCPNCGAPVHDGAVCSICGDPWLSC